MRSSTRECPDCHRSVREPFEKTVTGREVCPDCANALFMGTAAGVVTGNVVTGNVGSGYVGSGYGVWAMLMRKIRRSD
jgi:hypothetical protein